jgi:hypothetical protein
MRTHFYHVAAIAAFVMAATPVTAATRVYLLGGQSNAEGCGEVADLTAPYNVPQTNVNFTYQKFQPFKWAPLQGGYGNNQDTQFGPEVGFGYAIKAAFPTDDIYLVKVAVNGSDLAVSWKPDGTGVNYNTFKKTVNAALTDLRGKGLDPVISGMLWMQGESDAGIVADASSQIVPGSAAAYQTNLINLITTVRSDFATPNMPFVMGRILTYYGSPTDNALVRASQMNIPDERLLSNTAWVNTDDLPGALDHPGHYGATQQIELGNRFASALVQVPEPRSVVLLTCGTMSAAAFAWRKQK